uniref:RNase H type-1 domain-containing protein n=1 Tax=Stomoxys calcitrans TaxID=35570 RepID=A0A1I8QDC6_STOCA
MGKSVRICWIPGHQCGAGNVAADELATNGSLIAAYRAMESVIPSLCKILGSVDAFYDDGANNVWASAVGYRMSKALWPSLQYQSSRWDQQFGVFRSSPATEQPQTTPAPFDREALTAELIKFSKTLSASARFSPKLRRLTYTGSVPNLSTHHASQPLAYSTNISHLLSPNHKPLLWLEHKRHRTHRHHHHHHHHNHHHHHHNQRPANANNNISNTTTPTKTSASTTAINNNNFTCTTSSSTPLNSGRQIKNRGTRISNSLIQRATRESTSSMQCALLQPPNNKLHWHQAASFDETCRAANDKQRERVAERTKRSDTAKRHVLARQKPIEHEEDKPSTSPLGNRRCSTMSDSSYSGRWTVRCASIASRTSIVSRASSIDSRRIQVDLHSPEVIPKSILRSPKRYSSGPSTTPSVEKEFRSQLSVCSEPPAPIRQLSGQSSLEPCLPEEGIEHFDESLQMTQTESITSLTATPTTINPVDPPPPITAFGMKSPSRPGILKKPRPDSLPLMGNAALLELTKPPAHHERLKNLQRSLSSRTHDRPRAQKPRDHDDSIFYIRSDHHNNDFFDSEKVINERRSTLLKADSETALAERKHSSLSIPERILEQSNSLTAESAGDEEEGKQEGEDEDETKPPDDTVLQIEEETNEAMETEAEHHPCDGAMENV